MRIQFLIGIIGLFLSGACIGLGTANPTSDELEPVGKRFYPWYFDPSSSYDPVIDKSRPPAPNVGNYASTVYVTVCGADTGQTTLTTTRTTTVHLTSTIYVRKSHTTTVQIGLKTTTTNLPASADSHGMTTAIAAGSVLTQLIPVTATPTAPSYNVFNGVQSDVTTYPSSTSSTNSGSGSTRHVHTVYETITKTNPALHPTTTILQTVTVYPVHTKPPVVTMGDDLTTTVTIRSTVWLTSSKTVSKFVTRTSSTKTSTSPIRTIGSTAPSPDTIGTVVSPGTTLESTPTVIGSFVGTSTTISTSKLFLNVSSISVNPLSTSKKTSSVGPTLTAKISGLSVPEDTTVTSTAIAIATIGQVSEPTSTATQAVISTSTSTVMTTASSSTTTSITTVPETDLLTLSMFSTGTSSRTLLSNLTVSGAETSTPSTLTSSTMTGQFLTASPISSHIVTTEASISIPGPPMPAASSVSGKVSTSTTHSELAPTASSISLSIMSPCTEEYGTETSFAVLPTKLSSGTATGSEIGNSYLSNLMSTDLSAAGTSTIATSALVVKPSPYKMATTSTEPIFHINGTSTVMLINTAITSIGDYGPTPTAMIHG